MKNSCFKNFYQTRHIVYCPHSRLAARVALVTSQGLGWTAQVPLGWGRAAILKMMETNVRQRKIFVPLASK